MTTYLKDAGLTKLLIKTTEENERILGNISFKELFDVLDTPAMQKLLDETLSGNYLPVDKLPKKEKQTFKEINDAVLAQTIKFEQVKPTQPKPSFTTEKQPSFARAFGFFKSKQPVADVKTNELKPKQKP